MHGCLRSTPLPSPCPGLHHVWIDQFTTSASLLPGLTRGWGVGGVASELSDVSEQSDDSLVYPFRQYSGMAFGKTVHDI